MAKLKRKIYKTVVRPAMMNGVGTVAKKKTLDVSEIKMLADAGSDQDGQG